MMKKVLAITQLLLILVLISSCRNQGDKGSEFVFPESDSIPVKESEKLSREAIDDIVQNIGSPVEMAALLMGLEVPFISEHLASVEQAENLSTNHQKALRLDIYGADLGYLNIYQKTGTAVETLSTINKLADGLRVGQYFSFETLKNLALNKSNIDSLLFLSVRSYNQMDEYLRKNDRGYLSALMITGVWLEAQYLACQVVKDYPHIDLKNRIGEQKIIINDLLMLLRPYNESSDEYAELYRDIEMLKREYSDVDITYTPGEPETVEKDGRLIVVQKEESSVEFSDEVLKGIIIKTEEIRNKIVSL
ncbi:MAG TPA: hypothetical protein VJ877_01855 [Bacteroidales bacterium]|nr:hypothetical protein [Bacteroidales bacterium]